jgi:siroheme synthase
MSCSLARVAGVVQGTSAAGLLGFNRRDGVDQVVVERGSATSQRSVLVRLAKIVGLARNTRAPRPMTGTVTTQNVHGPLSVLLREPRPSAELEARRSR